VPIAPSKESFVSFVNATCIEIDLTAWKSGGCPIKYFSIKYKMKSEEMWTEVSNKIASTKLTMWIDGLHPQTHYQLKSTAFSDAGSTEAVYFLQTTSFADQGRLIFMGHKFSHHANYQGHLNQNDSSFELVLI